MKKIASFLLAGALACMAGTSKSKISSDLSTAVLTNSIQVVVQWNIEPGTVTAQKISALGGTVVSEFPSVHSGLYSIPSSALNTLSADPDVKYVSPDRDLRKKSTIKTVAPVAATINAPYAWSLGYNGAGIGVAVVDSGINKDDNLGLGKDHEPVYSEDFTGLMPKKKSGSGGGGMSPDWYGHGQHIAGIIPSNAKDSNCDKCNKSFMGIAPNVSLINLKVLDASGEGSDSAVIAAINRAISLKSTYNIRVMNLSLGRPVYESYAQDPLCQAVEAAWKAGIVVVVAAGNEGRGNTFGNEGYGTIKAPGNDPYVITIRAMRDMGTPDRSDDLIASYSSKGPSAVDHVVKPDLVAPGNQVVSLLATNGTLGLSDPQNIVSVSSYQDGAPSVGSIPVQPSYDPDSNSQPPNVKIGPGYSKRYYTMNGTSMAAAVASGAVADLLQAAPELTPDQVKMLLMETASKTFPLVSTVTDSNTGQSYTSYYDIFTVGAGYLDLKAALALVKQVPSGLTALSPTATYDPATGEVDLSFDPSSVFSDKAMWGASSVSSDKAMWGANSVSSNKAMWGAASMWSSSVLAGSKAMWGASVVWSASSAPAANKAMWGANSLAGDKALWGADSPAANKALWGASAIWSNKALWGASDKTASESVLINGEK